MKALSGPAREQRWGRAVLRSFGLGAALVALVPACGDSPVAPIGDVYHLATVNGEPLPGPFPDPQLPPNTFEVTAGTLTLRADGTLHQTLTMRCRTPLPAGTECHVDAPHHVYHGRHSRAEGHVELGGREFQADFQANRVTITLSYPPSMGFFMPTFVLEYRRRAQSEAL
jgi:hypothetical protein